MIRTAILSAAALASLACARTPSSAARLAPGEWRLLSIESRPAVPADLSRRPWIRFDLDSGRVSGNLGCNRAAGPFTLAGDSLRVGQVISTKMACADRAMNEQEVEFSFALINTTNYRLRGDTLDLIKESRVVASLLRMP